MIVVTGSVRTGTSMMMQTLVNLGIESLAPKFDAKHLGKEHHNPKGCYEFTDDDRLMNLTENDKGKCVKLWAYHFDMYVKKGLIDKAIVCVRDTDEALKSTKKVAEDFNYNFNLESYYFNSYRIIGENIDSISHLLIKFEDMLSNPKDEILKVVRFLNIKPTKEMMQKAIDNIN